MALLVANLTIYIGLVQPDQLQPDQLQADHTELVQPDRRWRRCGGVSVRYCAFQAEVLLRRFGQDPATAASIILTTVTDGVGFFSFLGIAALLAPWLGQSLG